MLVLTLAVGCMVLATAGCTDPNSVWNRHNLKYTRLCEDGDYIRAAFEFEYGLNQALYADKQHPRARYIGTQFLKEPLFGPLGRPENIHKLAELARYAGVLPRLEKDIRVLLSKRLRQPSDTPCRDLVGFYERNAGRLHWNGATRSFTVGSAVAPGRLLPHGFEPLNDAGKAQDGYPLRIRCLKDGSEMVYVPPGRFRYRFSSPDSDRWVTVGRFYIDRYETTNEQYRKFCKATKRKPPKYQRVWKSSSRLLNGFDGPRLPITCVLWDDAGAYCKWAGKELPSEHEWLRAALGESQKPFPWGKAPKGDAAEKERFAIYGRPWPEDGGKPAFVGGRQAGASPFGAEDMAGNVAEFLAGRTERGSYLAAGGAYMNNWPDRMDWRSISCRSRMTSTFTEAKPWVGFRGVLILKAPVAAGQPAPG